MANPIKWIRHSTDDGPRWSPMSHGEDEITKIGKRPNLDNMQNLDPVPVNDLEILPPAEPKRVVALAKNRKSVEKEPLVFLKTPSSVIAHNESIRIPSDRGRTWSEVELAIVVDKTAKDISKEEAGEYIRGYTIANDVTTENIEDRDWHLARGKALDTYCPTGPYLVTELETADLQMRTRVNGELTLETSTEKRLLDEADALATISSFITLEPGDLVLTGVPDSPHESTIRPGDTTAVEIEGIGELSNPVVEK